MMTQNYTVLIGTRMRRVTGQSARSSWRRRASALANASATCSASAPAAIAAASANTSSLWRQNNKRFATNAAAEDDIHGLRVFNTLTGKCESLPNANKVLKWYACGPTVYDKAHLGHARAYVSQDILRRLLERKFGRTVWLVMGVTDVDDKIIRRAQEENISFQDLARREERHFLQDMEQLHVLKPHCLTRVSEHMDEIIQYIGQIQDHGFAYQANDGSGVYFNTQKLGSQYGKLAPERNPAVTVQDIQPQDLETPAAAVAPAAKKDPRDFALWKATRGKNEPSWPSPWGPGRPGWHIECSAMTHHVLGDQLDVHSGGIDLRFPHHNNEIAQCDAHHSSSSCCDNHLVGNHASSWHWCRHFIHFGHLYIRGLKMSKSLKNFISIQEFLKTNSSDQFRLFCLGFKYRVNVHFSDDRMRDAQHVGDRIRSFLTTVQAYAKVASTHTQVHHASSTTASKLPLGQKKKCHQQDLDMLQWLFETKTQVDLALADDFDTPLALQQLLDLISKCHAYLLRNTADQIPSEVLYAVAKYVVEVMDLFGVEEIVQDFERPLHQAFAYTKAPFSSSSSSSSSYSSYSSSSTSSSTASGGSSGDSHATTLNGPNSTEILDCFVQFRASVREFALSKNQDAITQILAACDHVRNDELVQLGVQVEDLFGAKSIYKLLSRTDQTNKAFHQQETQAARNDQQEQVKSQQRQQHEAHTKLMQIAPESFFQQVEEFQNAFCAFDEQGFPLRDANDQELTKSAKKKLRKRLEKHRKAYDKFWAAQPPV